jgi:hypothetical protein
MERKEGGRRRQTDFVVIHPTIRLSFVFIERHVFEDEATMLTDEAIGVPFSVKSVDDSASDELSTAGTSERMRALYAGHLTSLTIVRNLMMMLFLIVLIRILVFGGRDDHLGDRALATAGLRDHPLGLPDRRDRPRAADRRASWPGSPPSLVRDKRLLTRRPRCCSGRRVDTDHDPRHAFVLRHHDPRRTFFLRLFRSRDSFVVVVVVVEDHPRNHEFRHPGVLLLVPLVMAIIIPRLRVDDKSRRGAG